MSMGQVMYIGPVIPGLVKKDTVFKDGLPAKIEKAAEKNKNFARLFVPAGKVFDAKKQLGTEGSALAVSYTSVENGTDSILNLLSTLSTGSAGRGTDGQHI